MKVSAKDAGDVIVARRSSADTPAEKVETSNISGISTASETDRQVWIKEITSRLEPNADRSEAERLARRLRVNKADQNEVVAAALNAMAAARLAKDRQSKAERRRAAKERELAAKPAAAPPVSAPEILPIPPPMAETAVEESAKPQFLVKKVSVAPSVETLPLKSKIKNAVLYGASTFAALSAVTAILALLSGGSIVAWLGFPAVVSIIVGAVGFLATPEASGIIAGQKLQTLQAIDEMVRQELQITDVSQISRLKTRFLYRINRSGLERQNEALRKISQVSESPKTKANPWTPFLWASGLTSVAVSVAWALGLFAAIGTGWVVSIIFFAYLAARYVLVDAYLSWRDAVRSEGGYQGVLLAKGFVKGAAHLIAGLPYHLFRGFILGIYENKIKTYWFPFLSYLALPLSVGWNRARQVSFSEYLAESQTLKRFSESEIRNILKEELAGLNKPAVKNSAAGFYAKFLFEASLLGGTFEFLKKRSVLMVAAAAAGKLLPFIGLGIWPFVAFAVLVVGAMTVKAIVDYRRAVESGGEGTRRLVAWKIFTISVTAAAFVALAYLGVQAPGVLTPENVLVHGQAVPYVQAVGASYDSGFNILDRGFTLITPEMGPLHSQTLFFTVRAFTSAAATLFVLGLKDVYTAKQAIQKRSPKTGFFAAWSQAVWQTLTDSRFWGLRVAAGILGMWFVQTEIAIMVGMATATGFAPFIQFVKAIEGDEARQHELAAKEGYGYEIGILDRLHAGGALGIANNLTAIVSESLTQFADTYGFSPYLASLSAHFKPEAVEFRKQRRELQTVLKGLESGQPAAIQEPESEIRSTAIQGAAGEDVIGTEEPAAQKPAPVVAVGFLAQNVAQNVKEAAKVFFAKAAPEKAEAPRSETIEEKVDRLDREITERTDALETLKTQRARLLSSIANIEGLTAADAVAALESFKQRLPQTKTLPDKIVAVDVRPLPVNRNPVSLGPKEASNIQFVGEMIVSDPASAPRWKGFSWDDAVVAVETEQGKVYKRIASFPSNAAQWEAVKAAFREVRSRELSEEETSKLRELKETAAKNDAARHQAADELKKLLSEKNTILEAVSYPQTPFDRGVVSKNAPAGRSS